MKQTSFIFSQPKKHYGTEDFNPIEQRSINEPIGEQNKYQCQPAQRGESHVE